MAGALRRLVREVSPYWVAMVLFYVSAALFLAVLVPSSFDLLPIFGEWPRVMTLEGTVRKACPGNETLEPMAGACVAIGGYRTFVDSTGAFSLRFVSPNSLDIPVVVSVGDQVVVQYVSYRTGETNRREDLVVR